MRKLVLAAFLAAVPTLASAAPAETSRIDMTRAVPAEKVASCLQVQRDLAAADAGSPAAVGALQHFNRIGCREALASSSPSLTPTSPCQRMRDRLAGEIAGFKRMDLSEAYLKDCAG